MGAVMSCFQGIGDCIMTVINAIAGVIMSIINGIVSVLAAIVRFLTCKFYHTPPTTVHWTHTEKERRTLTILPTIPGGYCGRHSRGTRTTRTSHV